jgi:hypothetical protein
MNAPLYNRAEMEAGRLDVLHVTAMTEIAQRELGLAVDGKCGPRTRAALEAQSTPMTTGSHAPNLTTVGGLMAEFPSVDRVAALAAVCALAMRGRGEEGGNNRGSFITEIGGRQGYLWCALFAGHAWRLAHEGAQLPPPAWTYRRAGVAEPGALALGHAAAEVGERFVDPARVLPGDLAVWERSGGHHVAIVWHPEPLGVTRTVEGNVGRYPAPVRDFAHDTLHEPHFKFFARPYRL